MIKPKRNSRLWKKPGSLLAIYEMSWILVEKMRKLTSKRYFRKGLKRSRKLGTNIYRALYQWTDSTILLLPRKLDG